MAVSSGKERCPSALKLPSVCVCVWVNEWVSEWKRERGQKENKLSYLWSPGDAMQSEKPVTAQILNFHPFLLHPSSVLFSSTFHHASRYALINFAFKALCLTSSSWHGHPPPPFTPTLPLSIHLSLLSFSCFYLLSCLSLCCSISVTHSPIRTHTYIHTQKLKNSVHDLPLTDTKEHCQCWPGG